MPFFLLSSLARAKFSFAVLAEREPGAVVSRQRDCEWRHLSLSVS